MIAIAHSIAILFYLGAAALAATPIARPVRAPVRWVSVLLGAGVLVHGSALAAQGVTLGQLPSVGLGPALSLAALFIAAVLLLVELIARDAALSIVAAPLAAMIATAANLVGLAPAGSAAPPSVWLQSHIALSFIGLAAFATAAAAGTMYLVERHELKSRRLAAVLRLFPPLDTLDRVNRVASIAAWVALTAGVSLAFAYAINFHVMPLPKMLWAVGAWVAVSLSVVARTILKWTARRTALLSGVAFAAIIVFYLVVRISAARGGLFL